MDYREDLNGALKALREGGIIIYPTDTIWGLGCDATNRKAVEKIFAIKKREESKSLIILVNGYQMLERYVENIPEAAAGILEVADKPITIIYPKGKNLAPAVLSSDGSVGIRICSDDFCNELITRFRKPLVSTSANISNTSAPGSFTEIDDDIIKAADYVVKHRQWETETKTPSSVIKVEDGGVFKIIRE
ncbi:MAG TPA: L-threonylcarbamoyladenylate synthase [Bacteroidales bacterium]|nr:L-threonylcarbamoyladenylate synthase [Bacteroidales bacterium]